FSKTYTHLAITNPKNAPYGLAAMQVMQQLRIWDKLQPQHIIIMGENVSQTMEFIESGHAELGFVALSQVMDPKLKGKGSRWEVPPHLHEPIQQDVILLTKGKENPGAKALLEFIGGPQAKTIIERYGYALN
ncbi:MAG TPA: molybdate ABC transporter substrate-binding protein, partial [Nitrospira sp.]|nr:molybdate ABC transporter substrate-binding protein [Nitrospira sp.]